MKYQDLPETPVGRAILNLWISGATFAFVLIGTTSGSQWAVNSTMALAAIEAISAALCILFGLALLIVGQLPKESDLRQLRSSVPSRIFTAFTIGTCVVAGWFWCAAAFMAGMFGGAFFRATYRIAVAQTLKEAK